MKFKSNYAQILIPIIGILIIISWMFLIVPVLKNDFSAFEELREYVGKDAYVESIGEKLPAPTTAKDLLEYNIVDVDGDIFEIKSTYTTYDQISGEKIYENTNTYFVDHTTRKHVGNEDWYFIFPFNVQKQNYLLLDPNMEVPATFVFEETKYLDGLEVYVFSCESFDDDFSDGFAEFAPTKIYGDQTCKTSIEPITGKTVQFSITWDFYAIQDGLHIPIEVGGTETTVFTEHILLQSAKESKHIFSIYDSVIPTFMLLTLGAVFSTSVYNKKSKEKGKIIKKQFEELKELDKKKRQFLTMISHELKTPLFPIQGNLEMLIKPDILGKLNKDQLDSIDEIQKNTNKLQIRINDLLLVSEIISGELDFQKETIKIKDLLDEVKKDSHLLISTKNFNFVNSTKHDLSLVTDKTKVKGVLFQLVQNAVEYIPAENGKIEINVEERDNEVIFYVKDNGVGISTQTQKELFREFYQLDMSDTRKHQGLGLGLKICKGIVEGLGGRIWVESEEGMGTTFFFTIPKAD